MNTISSAQNPTVSPQTSKNIELIPTSAKPKKPNVFNQVKRVILPAVIIGIIVAFLIYIYMVGYLFTVFKCPKNCPWYSFLYSTKSTAPKVIPSGQTLFSPPANPSVYTATSSPAISTSLWQTDFKEKYKFSFTYVNTWRMRQWNQFQKNSERNSQIISWEKLIKPVYATPEYDNYSPIPRENADSMFALWLQNPGWDDEQRHLEEKYNNYPAYYQVHRFNGAPQGIYINVWTVINVTTIDQLKNLYQDTYNQNLPETKIVNGNKTLVLKSKTVYPPEEKDMYPLYVWGQEATIFAANNYIYSVFYAGDKYRDAYDQILSTFKFGANEPK